jgi:pimeloyl-ACP methyl ester carboxylesterase
VTDPAYFNRDPLPRLAYRKRDGAAPTILFLPGYASDMAGAKAEALDAFADARGVGMVRFDYSGTGLSDGKFEDGTLATWLDDTLTIVDSLSDGPLLVVGSSMGGWIALLLALRRPDRVRAIVGIAAAPDFTDWGYTADEKAVIASTGRLEQPNPDSDQPWLTTRAFWEAGQQLCVMAGDVAVDCPVRLVHGDQDDEVPVAIASRLFAQLRSADVQLNIVKGGGHRLSQPHEIDAILRAVGGLLETL